jgi:hypothetical protein
MTQTKIVTSIGYGFDLNFTQHSYSLEDILLDIQIIQERRNNHLINYFSSSPEHALSNPVDLLKPTSHHNSISTPFLLQG